MSVMHTTLPFSFSSRGTIPDRNEPANQDCRYIVFDFVAANFVRKAGAGNWIAFITVFSGLVTISTGFVKNWQLLTVCRALVGICEVPHLAFLANDRVAFSQRPCISLVAGTSGMKFRPD